MTEQKPELSITDVYMIKSEGNWGPASEGKYGNRAGSKGRGVVQGRRTDTFFGLKGGGKCNTKGRDARLFVLTT